jgi:hypothetical protein
MGPHQSLPLAVLVGDWQGRERDEGEWEEGGG